MDVDKFDYIERDCYNLGIKSSYDTSRLMAMCRVVNDQICFHHKEVYSLYDMFHTRYSLFKRIYTHRVGMYITIISQTNNFSLGLIMVDYCESQKSTLGSSTFFAQCIFETLNDIPLVSQTRISDILTGKAIEYMITDVLLAADPYIHISNAVQQGEQYMNLTDDILRVIERSSSDELAPARAIIKRIRTRQLYKFVDEVLIPQNKQSYLTKDKINPREIIAYQDDNDRLVEEDVIVQWLRINCKFLKLLFDSYLVRFRNTHSAFDSPFLIIV